MGRGFASPAQYRGDDIKPALVSNWRALTTHLNSYVPTFNSDGTTLALPGDLTVAGSGPDHGGLTGKGDDDHTQYALADGTRDWVETTRVYASGTHSVANDGAWDIIYFDTEEVDDGGWHSTSTNTHRITVTDAGIYLIQAQLYWLDNDTVGYRMGRVLLNGTSGTGALNFDGSDDRFKTRLMSTVKTLSASDYLHVEARQNSATNPVSIAGGTPAAGTWFAVTRLG